MNSPKLILIGVASALLLSACSTAPSRSVVDTAVLDPGPALPAAPTPSQQTQTSIQNLPGLEFVAPAARTLLSERERTEATSAQFYALQFGRPGAPRTWSGDRGASGSITVGPYVRVNNLDCRDFTHTVTLNGTAYEQKGTACREADGSWSVESIG